MYFSGDIARLFKVSVTSVVKWLNKGYIPNYGPISQELYPRTHKETGFRIWDENQYQKWSLIAETIQSSR